MTNLNLTSPALKRCKASLTPTNGTVSIAGRIFANRLKSSVFSESWGVPVKEPWILLIQ